MSGSIALTYSSTTSYTMTVAHFLSNELPASIQPLTSIDYSTAGAPYATGPSYRQRYLWTLEVVMDFQQFDYAMALWRQWDSDRALGLAALVDVVDTTMPSTISGNAWFVDPPKATRMGSSRLLAVTMSLAQV